MIREYHQALAEVTAELTPEDLSNALEQGKDLPAEEAVALALETLE